MADIDVFNGDADGICALTQLRLDDPRKAQLITGVKRDISLVEKVRATAQDRITVLDVSLDKNRDGVQRALDSGAEVLYVDHHFAGEIPKGERLTTIINEAPDVCTSLLVNGHLKGRFSMWAVTGAFGDNLKKSALAVAKPLGLPDADLGKLEALGVYLNYNGYGERIEDLHFAPDVLFRAVSKFDTPLQFIAEERENFQKLADGYAQDMASAASVKLEAGSTDTAALFILPDAAWARRVSGVYCNELTNHYPDRAHAVLTEKSDGTYLVSVRAPLTRKSGADELCRQFPTGGGRAAAAGINALSNEHFSDFVRAFIQKYM